MYDLSHPVFQSRRELIRWAREHQDLLKLKSSVITWEAVETVTQLGIPFKYHVHYRIRSIIGIDAQNMPIFGCKHSAEFELPAQYPLEPCKVFMLTDAWHPNIKFKGRFKGRICAQAEKMGTIYELPLLVLRIGEILQYKNYHAEHVAPFPEDAEAAKWVLEFAEPKDIVNKRKGIFVDDTPLIQDYEDMKSGGLKILGQRKTEHLSPKTNISIKKR